MRTLILSGGVMFLAVTAIVAQQAPAPAGGGRGRGGGAPPGINWPSPPLADGPLMIDTGLVRPIKISITKGLRQPWSMAFVPDGSAGFATLVTERGGKLRIIRNGVLDPTPIDGLPADIQASGLAGLMDIQL